MATETVYPEMTIEEIETQFDGEWVSLGDVETDEFSQITRAKVLCHSVDRDEVYDYLSSVRGQFKRTETICFQKLPSEMRACYSNFGVVRSLSCRPTS